MNFYSLYSESFVPNGNGWTISRSSLVLIFDPSKGEGIDVGFKFDLIESSFWSVAFRYRSHEHLAEQSLAGASGRRANRIPFGAGKQYRLRGAALYTPTPETQLILSYVHNDAKIEETLIAGAQGLRLDQSAKNAVSITGRHTFGDTGFFVGGNWLYRQGPIQQFSIVRRECYQRIPT